jgi:hypothetical protein
MKKRTLGMALGLLTLLSACGSSKSSTENTGSTTSSSTAKTNGKFTCAKDVCTLPDSLKGEELCCMDPFKGGCGIKSGGSCRSFPTIDDRCPVPDLNAMAPMGIEPPKAFGCCTANNECGVDFGMGGCQARTFLCQFISKDAAAMLNPETCDGEAMPLPANCGRTTPIMLPGAAGGGS